MLKAESQEIDRIIEGFSSRYYDCNPTSIFGSPGTLSLAFKLILGVIHTVTAAMLMLNTDLHIADLVKHMSRVDFIRNAMSAIKESTPTDGASTPDLIRDDASSRMGSLSTLSNQQRHKVPPAQRSASAPVTTHQPGLARVISDAGLRQDSSTTVNSFYSKAWELEAENALKDIYAAVRSDRILLPTSNSTGSSNRHSMISLANSFDHSKGRTLRSPSDRVNVLKRGSVRMNNPYGSNFNGSDGRLSPTGSYANSINEVS